jgi:hypothetical protein
LVKVRDRPEQLVDEVTVGIEAFRGRGSLAIEQD